MVTRLGGIALLPARRNETLARIRRKVEERGLGLAEEIRDRQLYFRVSVVGTCNLHCGFCHNEGALSTGKLPLEIADRAIAAASRIGFTRVQFTGGEPLLRPDIADFVRVARRYVTDVGVTTNGTYLPQRLDGLVAAGLHRLHVSLQTEPLDRAGRSGEWGIPEWLLPTVERAASGSFGVRFNLPVPADCLTRAEPFLRKLVAKGIDVKVFSVLPEGDARTGDYPMAELTALVERVNADRPVDGPENGTDMATGSGTGSGSGSGVGTGTGVGTVFLRGFRPPSGIRCGTCPDSGRCQEQSHSLRLGADLALRPCLATRNWDSVLSADDLDSSIRDAAYLALDYRW